MSTSSCSQVIHRQRKAERKEERQRGGQLSDLLSIPSGELLLLLLLLLDCPDSLRGSRGVSLIPSQIPSQFPRAMLGFQQETPSRILRRIQAAEAQDDELPTLPSPLRSEDVSNSGINFSNDDSRLSPSALPTKTDSSSSSMVARKRPLHSRRILTPINLNNSSAVLDNSDILSSQLSPANAIKRHSSKGDVKQESPRTVPSKQALKDRNNRSAPSTIASTASSNRTVRPAPAASSPQYPSYTSSGRSPVARITGPAAGARRSKQVSFDDSTNLNDLSLGQLEASSPSSLIDLDESEQGNDGLGLTSEASLGRREDTSDTSQASNLEEVEAASMEQSRSEAQQEQEEAEDVSATPVPRSVARFEGHAPPSPIIEEEEGEGGVSSSIPAINVEDSSSLSPGDLPSMASPSTGDKELSKTANVVIRRKTNPVIGHALPSPAASGSSSDTPARPSSRTSTGLNDLPDLPSPAEHSIGSTPGMARRLPSAERLRFRDDVSYLHRTPDSKFIDTETPGRTNTSPSYLDTVDRLTTLSSIQNTKVRSDFGEFATPRPTGNDSDLERRKNHLLSTLRLTAMKSATRPRLKLGTPHPLRRGQRAQSATPARGNDISRSYAQEASSTEHTLDHTSDMTTASSVSSNNDLTSYPKGSGNTSLPLTGIAGGSETGHGRFNGAKLNNYLHTLNTHLSEENQNLVKTLEETAREVERLMKQNAELSSSGVNIRDASSSFEEETKQGAQARQELIENHRKTSDDIQKIKDQLSIELQESHGAELDSLRKQVEQRDADITSLRKQLLDRQQDDQAEDLQRQVFHLQDDLKALQEHKDTDVEAQLQKKDEEIEELQAELREQDLEFAEKMKNLEEELCKVMEEQEEQLRATTRELAALRDRHETQVKLGKDKEQSLHDLAEELNAVKGEKDRLQQLLDDTGSSGAANDATGSDAVLRERLAILQGDLARAEATIRTKEDQVRTLSEEAANTGERHSAQSRDLQSQLDAMTRQEMAAQRQLSAQSVILKELQSSLDDAEDRLQSTEARVAELQHDLDEARSQVAKSEATKANLTLAIDNDLQAKLDAAQREIGNLKHQLASPSPQTRHSPDSKDIEIKTLKSSNHELASRVDQLRRQALANTMLMGTPGRGGDVTGNTPEKSVRFNNISSMKTPRTASQMLANMSLFDKTVTDWNASITPLYKDIDTLHDQVKHLQGLLQHANEDVDDKLRKLDRAGASTVELVRKLETAQARIRDLEDQVLHAKLSKNGGGRRGDESVVAELKAVQNQLTEERADLTRRLSAIEQVSKSPCSINGCHALTNIILAHPIALSKHHLTAAIVAERAATDLTAARATTPRDESSAPKPERQPRRNAADGQPAPGIDTGTRFDSSGRHCAAPRPQQSPKGGYRARRGLADCQADRYHQTAFRSSGMQQVSLCLSPTGATLGTTRAELIPRFNAVFQYHADRLACKRVPVTEKKPKACWQ